MNCEAAIPVEEAIEELVPQRRFRPYPVYRDSGTDWLGLVPEGWEVVPLRHICGSIQTGPFGSQLHQSDYQPGGIPLVNPVHLVDGHILQRENSAVDEDTRVRLTRHILQEGDIFFARRGEIGRCGLVSKPQAGWLCGTGCMRVRLKEGHAPYFTSLFNSHGFAATLTINAVGTTMLNINNVILARMGVPCPPRAEQVAIAAFLDRETARIDELVAKKQRLIELLQEKRTALISHAVTKGLNPDAPMMDYGVEWFGAIPSHWSVKRLKHIVPKVTVGIVITPARYYVDSGVPALRSLNVSSGRIVASDLVFMSSESNELHRKSKIFSGDIVVVRTGQTGIAAIVTDGFDGANCVDLVIIRRSDIVMTSYLHYSINSLPAVRQVEAKSVGSLQAHYNTYTVKELVVPTPPLDEQRQLCAYLHDRTEQLDRAADHIRRGLDALHEYRSALISAAVTGKIDVREEQQ